MELVLNMLAEVTTKEISKKEDPVEFVESQEIARRGGSIAGNARKEIEGQLGRSVVTFEKQVDSGERKRIERKKGK